jgi:hypothetical protein
MHTSAYAQDFLTKIHAYTYFLTLCFSVTIAPINNTLKTLKADILKSIT